MSACAWSAIDGAVAMRFDVVEERQHQSLVAELQKTETERVDVLVYLMAWRWGRIPEQSTAAVFEGCEV